MTDRFYHKEDMEYNYQDGSKVFFTSDHHFGHENIIRFCNRPWVTISEHNRALIANWNAIVPEYGIVFHLGDFSYKGGGFPAMWWIKGLLHGQIVLIRGNHDPDTRKPQNLQQLQQIFEGVFDQLEIKVEGQRILMNHYPLLTWPHIYDQKMPTWQIFGHVHLFNGKSDVYRSSIAKCCIPTQYEVGVDLNNYRPISFHQLKERIEYQVQHACNVTHWL